MAVVFNLRMGAELKAQLDEAVQRSGRSLNKEILVRLLQSFELEGLRERVEAERAQERAAMADMQRRNDELTDRLLKVLDR
jgi:hypothetical protein